MVNSLLCSLLSFNIHGGIESHLRGLRRYLLMDAGDFADQLSSSLFDIVCISPFFVIIFVFWNINIRTVSQARNQNYASPP